MEAERAFKEQRAPTLICPASSPAHPLIIPLNFARPASSHGMCPPETSAMFTPLHIPFALHTGPSAWNAISTCQLGWNVLVIHVLFKFLLISLALELVGHICLPKL